MTDTLRLTIDFDLPADLFERSEFITRIGAPIGEMRTALTAIVGAPVAIKHEIVGAAPAEPARRGRGPNKPKVSVTEEQMRAVLIAGAAKAHAA